jgi:hypothetical protein
MSWPIVHRRDYLGSEELELPSEVTDAVQPSARPALNQARIDQAERDVVIAVRREVRSQAFESIDSPVGGRTHDRAGRQRR